MSKRPYLSKSVVQMEAIYEASRADSSVVDLLMKELAFRTTQKATALARRGRELQHTDVLAHGSEQLHEPELFLAKLRSFLRKISETPRL